MNDFLLSNIRYYFAQSVFLNSIHYKAYARIRKRKERLSRVVICVSAVTVVLLILQVIAIDQKSSNIIQLVTYFGLLTSAVAIIVELFSKEDLSLLLSQHKHYAEKYRNVRDEYMSLIEEVMSGFGSEEHLHQKRDKLQKRYSEIGELAPETTYDDYTQAQIGLGLDVRSGEEFTWSDVDINKFLPEKLRLIKP